MTLNPKQQRFVEEYLIDLNATQAAIRAGYSEKTAYSQGHDLLKKPEIQDAISKGVDNLSKKTEITAERILSQLANIAFGDVRKIFDADGNLKRPEDIDDETAASIAGIEFSTVSRGEGAVDHVAKIKQSDKIRALELLGKYHSLFTDKVEHSGDKESPVLVQIVDDLPRKTK